MAFIPDEPKDTEPTKQATPSTFTPDQPKVVNEASQPKPSTFVPDEPQSGVYVNETVDDGSDNLQDAIKAQRPEAPAPLPAALPDIGGESVGVQLKGKAAGMAKGVVDTFKLLGPAGIIAGARLGRKLRDATGIPQVGPDLLGAGLDKWDELIGKGSEAFAPAVQQGQEAFQRDLQMTMEGGGVVPALALSAANAAWNVSLDLLAMKAVTGGVPGSATAGEPAKLVGKGLLKWNPAAIKGTIRHAGAVAAYKAAVTPGTEADKAKAAATTIAYLITPAVSTGAPTDAIAKFADFLLNTGITVGTGQYSEARQQAEDMAAEAGEDWASLSIPQKAGYLAVTMTPLAVSDAYFSAKTRSSAAQMKPFGGAVAKIANDVDALERIAPEAPEGARLPPEVKADIEARQEPAALTIKVGEAESISRTRTNLADIMHTLPRSAQAKDRARATAEGNKDLSMRIEERVAQVLDRLGGVEDKPVPVSPSVERLGDLPAKLDAVPAKADGSVDMEARQGVVDAWKADPKNAEVVRGGEVDGTVVRKGDAQTDNAIAISSEGAAYRGMTEQEYNATVGKTGNVESRGDFRLSGEGTNLAKTFSEAESYVNFGRDDPRKTGRPTYVVETPQTGLRENRRGEFESDSPTQAVRVWRIDADGDSLVARDISSSPLTLTPEGRLVGAETQQPTPTPSRPITPQDFNDRVDAAVAAITPPSGQKGIRTRLNKLGLADKMNEFAKTKGYEATLDDKGKDVTRRSMTEPELKEFAESEGIRFAEPVKDNDATADIVKVAYDSDSPEEALSKYNQLSQLKKRPMITDTEAIARGGDPIETVRYAPTEREVEQIRNAMPRKLRGTENGELILNQVTGSMKHPLSADPKSRRMELRLISNLATQAEKGLIATRDGTFKSQTSMLAKANLFESTRYVFSELASQNGDQRIFDLYRDVDVQSRRSTKWVEDRLDSLFAITGERTGSTKKPAKFARELRHFVQAHPDIGDAIKVLIGTDPNTSGETGKARIAAAEATISGIKSVKAQAQVKELTNTIMDELQTVSATNVRMLQVYRFGDFWNRSDESGKTWGQKFIEMRDLGEGRTPKQSERFGGMQKELEGFLPKWSDSEGKVKNVEIEELIKQHRTWQKDGPEALRESLDQSTWGTRKHYWMTENDSKELQLQPKLQDAPAFGTKQAAKKVKETGAINSRTGIGVDKSGDLLSTLYKHMHVLQTQADTYHSANGLRGRIGTLKDEGKIPDELFKHTDMWVNSMWGKYQSPSATTKMFMKGNAAFWTAYPLALTRIAWYSGRNVLYQGMPWGPLNVHFRVGDVQAAYPGIMGTFVTGGFRQGKGMTDGSSRVRKYHHKLFQSDISQQRAIFFEQMLMSDPGESIGVGRIAPKLGVKQQQVWNFAASLTGASDSFNRLMGLTGYVIADKHVDSFIKSRDGAVTRATASGDETVRVGRDVTKADVFNRLKISTMHVSQQATLSDKFNDARETPRHSQEWDSFIETIAEMKQENINYVYRISGKSAIEQDPNARPFVGIATYARGQINEVYRNGIQPIMRAAQNLKDTGDLGNIRDMEQGGALIAKSIVAHALASVVAGYLIGEKRDRMEFEEKGKVQDPNKTIPTYGWYSSLVPPVAESPGYALVAEFRKEGIKALYNIAMMEPEKFKKNAEWFLQKGVYFSGFMPAMKAMFEAAGNKRAVSNIDFVMSGLSVARGTTEHRTAWEKFVQHPVFGTADESDERDFTERVIDSEQVILKPLAKILDK